MQTHIEASESVTAAVNAMLPGLESVHVSSVSVFATSRPGESEYWVSYLRIDGQRYVVATPELRNLPLDEQAEDLCRQMQEFVDSRRRPDARP